MTATDEPLTDDTIAALRAEAQQALHSAGAETALRLLEASKPTPADRAKVVVIGEVGSGKTSLINAVLDRPSLLPDQPTSTYVGIGSSAEEGIRIYLTDGQVQTAALDDLEFWMSPAQRHTHAATNIEVFVNDPLLGRLTFFDTPGVGGTDPLALTLTLDAIDQASALLFVCSAEAKISLAERDFLRKALQRIEHVVFVLTKVDLLDDLGAANLEENETTLAAEARQRYQPNRFSSLSFLPVSALLAIEGARGDSEALADSGIIELRQRLDEIAEQHSVLARLNEMRAIRSAISEAHALVGRQKRSLSGADREAEKQRASDRLNTLRAARTNARTELNRRLRNVQNDVTGQMRRDIRALRQIYEDRAATASRSEIDTVKTQLTEDLCTLQHTTIDNIITTVSELAEQATAELFDTDDVAEQLHTQLGAVAETPADYLPQSTQRAQGRSEQGMGMLRSGVSGNMIGNVVGGLIGASVMGPVVGIALMVATDHVLKSTASDRAGLSKWATTFITAAQEELSLLVSTKCIEASHEVPAAVDKAYDEAIAECQSTIAALKTTTTDHAAAVGQLNTSTKALRQLGTRWDKQHRALRAQLDAPQSSPDYTGAGHPTPHVAPEQSAVTDDSQ